MKSPRPPRNLTVKRGITYKVQSAAQTLTNVVKDAVLTGVVKADQQKVKDRLAICSKCEHFNGTTCNICGCFMRFKSTLTASKCPIGKW